MYQAYYIIRHSNLTLLAPSNSCFSPYLPIFPSGSLPPFRTQLSEPRLTFKLGLWWDGGARRQTVHHKHSAAPLMAFKTEIVRISGSASRSIGKGWDHMILPGREDPRNLGLSKWDLKMGKIECEIRWMIRWYMVQDEMLSTSGSPEYILAIAPFISITPGSPSAPITLFISVIPVSPYTRHKKVLRQAQWRRWLETNCPATSANTSFTHVCNQPQVRLPRMQVQKSLTFNWRSLSEWVRERVTMVFASKGSDWLIYGCLQPIAS